MRTSLVAVAVVLLTLPVLGQGGGVTMDGWQARLDSGRGDVNDLSFRRMGGGFHVTTGPHAIFWNPSNTGLAPTPSARPSSRPSHRRTRTPSGCSLEARISTATDSATPTS